MISRLRGTVLAIALDSAVIEVGGVGLHVRCPPRTLSELRLGQEGVLATSLVVREDSLTLFGFGDSDERDTFELIQTASGVGPKVAQAMLAVHTAPELRSAIARADYAALTAVPGIGKKGAERIVVELKDRVGPVVAESAPSAVDTWRESVHEALTGLGWSDRDASRAIENAAQSIDGSEAPDVPSLLRLALQSLAK